MIPAPAALDALREGNSRFVGENSREPGGNARRRQLAAGQEPFAIILGCSDARVPAEIVFDQGLGDLFVVLGHSNFGAVHATLQQLVRPRREQSRNLSSIVDRIRPAVEGLLERGPARDLQTLEQLAVRANIRMSADHLRHGSAVLEQLIHKDGLMVVGAEYSLETGVVDFFDGVPAGR